MPAFRLYRISDPSVLKSVAPSRLLQFLTLFRPYLESREFNWPGPDAPTINYGKLSRILLSPDDSLPSEMVRALLFVDEMSSDDRMDQLLGACTKEDIVLDLGLECTPADVAIQTWLQAPEILERQHAGAYALRQRNFHYFAGRGGRAKRFPKLSEEALQQLTEDLDDGEGPQELAAVLSPGNLRCPLLRYRERSHLDPRGWKLAARPVSRLHWRLCIRRPELFSARRMACAQPTDL